MKRSKSLPSPRYKYDKSGKPVLKLDPIEEELSRAVLMYNVDYSTVLQRNAHIQQNNETMISGMNKEINELLKLLQVLMNVWLGVDDLDVVERLPATSIKLHQFRSKCCFGTKQL